jgi:O-acetyl-ADP-ribose deacetylase (regulator of RNase III)
MTITIEKRDLFTVPQGYYLAHCISADFALGAGIAKKFDEVYNMRFKLFREYDMYEYEGGDALLIDNVYNLVTKKKCYHKPTYESVREALEIMKDLMDFNSTTKLAMPKIASGLDRCDWNKVYDIICEVFEDTDVEILICEL